VPGATYDAEATTRAAGGEANGPDAGSGLLDRGDPGLARALAGSDARPWLCDLRDGTIRPLAAEGEGGPPLPRHLRGFFDRVHRRDAGRVRRTLRRSVRHGSPFDLTFRLDDGSGDYRCILLRGMPVASGRRPAEEVVGLALDVTGRRQAEFRGFESGRMARGLLDSLPAQVAVLDEQGRILAVNRAWREMDGGSAGPPWAEGADYLACCERAADAGALEATDFAQAVRDVLGGDLASFVREYPLPTDEGLRWFEGRIVRFEGEGPPRAVASHYEVTDRRKAEDAARALNDRLRVRLQRSAATRRVDVAIASGQELGRVLDLILAEARVQLRAEGVAVLRLGPSGQTLETVRALGLAAGTTLPARGGLAGRVLAENRPVGVADLRLEREADPRAADLDAGGFVAYRGVPLRSRGGPLGVLEVYLRSEPPPEREWAEFLETLADQAAIAFQNARLAEETRKSHEELSRACEATIEGWSRALEMRDKETQGHSRRVTEMTVRLARELGVPEDRMIHIRRGALLHDIGKMGVPDRILLKPGPLSPEEWAIMQMHPTFALRMLWPIDFLRPALEIPYAHHERWDGSGYPRGLKGEQIPLPARIFAVVDVWDALSHDRPYRRAWPPESVREHLRHLAGTQLDPTVVEVFLRFEAQGASFEAEPPRLASPIDASYPEPCPAPEPIDAPDPGHAGPTVLVADDHPEVVAYLHAILDDAGFVVRTARDGRHAWAILQREDIAIVLTDWSMPGVDGLELCRRVRRREEQPYTYVILLTGRTDSRDRLEGMRAGADDYLVKPIDRHELIARLEIARRILGMQRTILERSAQAERLAAELRLQNERLAELAWTDGLTGLCNRRRFLDSLDSALSLAARRDAPLSVALIDVDRFKQYNDAHGHQAGDEVLRQVAELLRRHVRAHDLPARHGGEEFLVLLPETDAQAALCLAERLRVAIEAHPWPHRLVTASLGVATAEAMDARDPSVLLDRADRALYHSKRTGRNRVTHFDEMRGGEPKPGALKGLFKPVIGG
jgi:diguanylate cyclase (GGDEF)-like protein